MFKNCPGRKKSKPPLGDSRTKIAPAILAHGAASGESQHPLGWAMDFLGIHVVYGDWEFLYKSLINPVYIR